MPTRPITAIANAQRPQCLRVASVSSRVEDAVSGARVDTSRRGPLHRAAHPPRRH
jgi:hypothetical protein